MISSYEMTIEILERLWGLTVIAEIEGTIEGGDTIKVTRIS